MNKWKKVSVVMSNYNGMKLDILTESLGSILKNNYPNLEIILVDNASTDNSLEAVKRKFSKDKKLTVIKNSVNMYSQGLNLGISSSSGDYIAFFNNDVVVEDGYFQKFVKYLDKNKNIGLAQGKLLSYFDHSIIDGAGETTDIVGSPITIGAHEQDGKKYSTTVEILSVSGSCSMMRKDVIDRVGYFDDDYGIGYEDLDMALRARLKGYKVIYYPEVSAFHKRGSTDLSPEIRAKVRWHFNKNRFITILKDFPILFVLKSIPMTILLYILTGLAEMILKRKARIGLTRFTSIWWVCLNIFRIIAKRKNIRKGNLSRYDDKIQVLLYHNTLTQGFLSFIKVK